MPNPTHQYHRIYAVTDETAECVDCRRQFKIDHLPSTGSVEDKLKEITVDSRSGIGFSSVRVGYCKSQRLPYINTSTHMLSIPSLGLTRIGPWEVFELGIAVPFPTLRKYAPQLQLAHVLDRRDTGTDLDPLSAEEKIRFTIGVDFDSLSYLHHVKDD